jgi:hypothetical protein
MLASSSFFPSVDDDDDLFSMKLVLLHRSILPDLQQPEENHQHQQQMLDPSSFMQNFTILAIKDLQEPHTDLFLTRSLNLLCHQSELSLFHKHELLLFPLAVRILRRLSLRTKNDGIRRCGIQKNLQNTIVILPLKHLPFKLEHGVSRRRPRCHGFTSVAELVDDDVRRVIPESCSRWTRRTDEEDAERVWEL